MHLCHTEIYIIFQWNRFHGICMKSTKFIALQNRTPYGIHISLDIKLQKLMKFPEISQFHYHPCHSLHCDNLLPWVRGIPILRRDHVIYWSIWITKSEIITANASSPYKVEVNNTLRSFIKFVKGTTLCQAFLNSCFNLLTLLNKQWYL